MVHTSVHLLFLALPLGKGQEQRGRKTHGKLLRTLLRYTTVAPLTSAFPVSGMALGFQQCNTAEDHLLESPETFMYVSRSPRRSKGKMRVQEKLDDGGDGTSMCNLQGKAGGIVLVWVTEEKVAVRDRAVLKASGLTYSPWPVWEDGMMVHTVHLRVQKDSPLYHCSKLR